MTAAGGQGEQPSEPEGGLPAGAIVAITAGSVAGAAASAAAICFAVRKRKQYTLARAAHILRGSLPQGAISDIQRRDFDGNIGGLFFIL